MQALAENNSTFLLGQASLRAERKTQNSLWSLMFKNQITFIEKNLKTTLLYSIQDYIGAFSLLDALPYIAIRPEHVKPFVKAENDLQSTIDLAKQVCQSSQDNNLYALIVGAESAINAANEVLEADAKDRKVEIFG